MRKTSQAQRTSYASGCERLADVDPADGEAVDMVGDRGPQRNPIAFSKIDGFVVTPTTKESFT